MRLPNVIGVGIGLRGRKRVIQLLVKKKVSGAAAEVIPKSLEGYAVVVVEAGVVRADIDGKEPDGT